MPIVGDVQGAFPGEAQDAQPGGVDAELTRARNQLHASEERFHALNAALQSEIEKRETARARLNLALGASGMIGVWDGDLEAGVVYCDEHFARIHGLDPAETVAGKPLRFYDRFMHPDDIEGSDAERERMRAGSDNYSHEHRMIRPDGEIVWVHARGRLIRDAAGKPTRFLGVSVDITARKQAEVRHEFLLGLQDLLRSLSDPPEILIAAATHLGQYLGANRIGYGEVQPDDETVVVTCGYVNGVAPVNGSFPLAAFGRHNAARMREGQTIVYDDVLADPRREHDSWEAIGTRGHVSVPLIRLGRYTGSLYVSFMEAHRWTVEEVSLIEEVASRIWDAAERGRAEVKLRESEERGRLALESGGFGAWEYDVPSGKTIRSFRHDQIYGYASPVAEWGAERFAQHIPAPDRERVVEGFRATLETGRPWHAESRITRVDGSNGWIEISAKAHTDRDGRVVRLFGTVADVSARKLMEAAALQSAAQFEVFAQAMPNHVWTANPDGGLDWFNNRVLEYSGFAVSDLINDGWTRIVHPQDLPLAIERWSASLTRGDQYEVEFRLLRADGAWRWHIARAVPIRGGDGTLQRWIGTNTDIEDQKTTARALADLNATLEQQVQARTAALMTAEQSLRQSQKMEAVGQLTGGLAHDFNNLLTAISGGLEILERQVALGKLDDLGKYIEVARGAAKRAAGLTHRLLAFSRRQTLDPKPTDINALVHDLHDLIQRTTGPSVHVEVRQLDQSCVARVDANQLENALLNLCINARDAMPNGGRILVETGSLQIDASNSSEFELAPGAYVALSVGDTGTGMTPDVIARAFDPFFTTKPLGAGTGLGLSMVYGFARQSGGQARISSEVGSGTRISLFLPRLFGEDTVSEPIPAGVEEPAAPVAQTVLIVDDEADIRFLIATALEELGYKAVEAENATAGLKLLEAGLAIDLLVTDVGLPGGINGRQLADLVRVSRPELKILFITGYAEQSVIGDRGLDPGMHVLAKPFKIDDLVSKIGVICSGSA